MTKINISVISAALNAVDSQRKHVKNKLTAPGLSKNLFIILPLIKMFMN